MNQPHSDAEQKIIDLAQSKNLLDPDLVTEFLDRSEATQTSAITMMIDEGILTQHVVNKLAEESGATQVTQQLLSLPGYRIVGLLGEGGMGSVYKAIQLSVDRTVALKVMASHFAKQGDAGERFIREAKTAAKVNSPYVINIIDVSKHDGQYYMALEFVEGGDAEQLAEKSGGKLEEKRALEIIRDASKGLKAIHKVGLLHRDIKPANIFIDIDGVAKLADLGLARAEDGEDRMTQTGATVGTPAFMSPDQAEGLSDLDVRSDIYALGATLYALVCGEPPYTGSSAWAVVAKAINDPVPDPKILNPDLGQGCADLIQNLMSKDRSQRPQSPEDLLLLINDCIETGCCDVPQCGTKKKSAKNKTHAQQSNKKDKKISWLKIAAGAFILLLIISALSDKDPEQTSDQDKTQINNSASDIISKNTSEQNSNNPSSNQTASAEQDRHKLPFNFRKKNDNKKSGNTGNKARNRATLFRSAAHSEMLLSQQPEKVIRGINAQNASSRDIASKYCFGIGHFGRDNAGGPDITVDGKTYRHGLATHPPKINDYSEVAYNLTHRYAQFSGTVALNDVSIEHNFKGSLTFTIYADDVAVWTSQDININRNSEDFKISIRGVKRLRLRAQCTGTDLYAQAVWLDPKLLP
ncbi:MAG: protein kinase [Planctomycetes bacterium]|nr:protein kinase [Planctomycetota bacterium]